MFITHSGSFEYMVEAFSSRVWNGSYVVIEDCLIVQMFDGENVYTLHKWALQNGEHGAILVASLVNNRPTVHRWSGRKYVSWVETTCTCIVHHLADGFDAASQDVIRTFVRDWFMRSTYHEETARAFLLGDGEG